MKQYQVTITTKITDTLIISTEESDQDEVLDQAINIFDNKHVRELDDTLYYHIKEVN